MGHKKVKRINIYINSKDRFKLNELKNKYHLSYSTIANIITGTYYSQIKNDLEDHYIYEKDNSTKTSIKPNIQGEVQLAFEYKNLAIVFTNAIKIFLRNDLIKYLPEKRVQKLNNIIYNQFQNTYDENWDGNRFCRQMPKFIKNNKEYIRKILED